MKKIMNLNTLVIVIFFAICIFFQPERFFGHKYNESVHPQVELIDPVSMSVDAIRHQGKLVVADVVFHSEAISKMDSSVFDAQLKTSQKVRTQVWLDLSKVNSDWVTKSGNNLSIRIPLSAISSDHIVIQTNHHDNASMAFFFYGSLRNDLEKKNQEENERSFRSLENNFRLSESPLVAAQLARLFQTILTPFNIKVDATIDNTK